MSSRRMTFRVDAKLEQEIERAALARGVNTSRFIRETLAKSVKSNPRVQESAYDLAVRTGFLGATSCGPRDLATNKKYFEGFGE